MTSIQNNLNVVQQRITKACAESGRKNAEVALLAVSKTWPESAVRTAAALGQKRFGESYVQEALEKIAATRDLDIEWHFIGPLQSNKTRAVAEHFAWVHGIDRLKIAQRLSAQRPPELPPLQVCIQVNVSGEESKSGVAPEEVLALARAVAALPQLQLRGLMAIPEPTQDMALLHQRFRTLSELQGQLHAEGISIDTLSMGMSDDFDVAIAEGANIVRVGTAIFGGREYL